MTPSQIDELRKLCRAKKQANAAYHHALQTKAADSIRHAAELACVHADEALARFQAKF